MWGGGGWERREKNFMMSLSLIFPLALVHEWIVKPIDATPAVLFVGCFCEKKEMNKKKREMEKYENVYPFFNPHPSLVGAIYEQKKRQ